MPAANIKTAIDFGDAMTAYGGTIAYKKKAGQPQLGTVNYTLRVDDDINIAPFVFQFDDLNVNGGSTHRTWSAAEIAVTMLPGNRGSHQNPYDGSHTEWNANSTFFTATVAGRVRFSATNIGSSHYHIWLNQIFLFAVGSDDLYADKHRCVIVAPGDIVGMTYSDGGSTTYVSWMFLPEVYES